jgi:hypothetical protein
MRGFILIILLLTTKFYGILVFSEVFEAFFLSDIAIMLLIGAISLKSPKINTSFKPLIIFIALAFFFSFLSVFVSWYDWGQSFVQSFVVNRGLLLMFFAYFLIRYKVSKSEILSAIRVFVYGYVILVILSLFSDDLHILFQGEYFAGGIKPGIKFVGIQFVLLYFLYLLDKVLFVYKITKKEIFELFLLFAVLVLSDNRSYIFGSVIVGAYFFLIKRNQYLFWKKQLFSVFLFIFLSYMLYDRIFLLTLETNDQLNNLDYNRWKAFTVFSAGLNETWWSYVFGNGYASLNSLYGDYIHSLKLKGIYQSDLGILGLWTIYGSFFVSLLFYYLYKIIKETRIPFYLKMYSLKIILTFWIYSFIYYHQIIFFMILFYLFEYERLKLKNN